LVSKSAVLFDRNDPCENNPFEEAISRPIHNLQNPVTAAGTCIANIARLAAAAVGDQQQASMKRAVVAIKTMEKRDKSQTCRDNAANSCCESS